MAPRFLAAVLILQYLVMAVLYALGGDWRRSIYWVAAQSKGLSLVYSRLDTVGPLSYGFEQHFGRGPSGGRMLRKNVPDERRPTLPFPLLLVLLLMPSLQAEVPWQTITRLNIPEKFIIYCRGASIPDCYRLLGERMPKVAVLDIQTAIAQTKEGQQAARQLQSRFAPKRAELEKTQKEIADLQTQLRGDRALSEEARLRLLRSVDDKTSALDRTNRETTAEFQRAEQEAIDKIGMKMLGLIDKHAQKNGYDFVLDVSSSGLARSDVPNSSVARDITKQLIDEYDKSR